MPLALPQTQSAAALSQASRKLQTGCQALDDLLKGGVQGGHILELSGPPGTPKELVVMNLIGQFVNDQNDVLIAGRVTSLALRGILNDLQIAKT
jgi:RAD51-like protein 2